LDVALYFLKFIFLLLIYLFFFQFLNIFRAERARKTRDLITGQNGETFYLEVISGQEKLGVPRGHLFPLSTFTNIGRANSNDLVVDDDYVSSFHARILSGSAGHFLEDLGSKNSTFLNSDPVKGKVSLHEGDVIRIGGSALKFKKKG
jgi:pSer/pThr/pTyr-binding forkhead associated (FHA) protein